MRVQRRIHKQDGGAVRGVLAGQLQGCERVVRVLGVREGDVFESERRDGMLRMPCGKLGELATRKR